MNWTGPFKPRPYLLEGKIQHYAWGTKGRDAFIPRLLGIEAEADLSYAELWIGAHPKSPGEIVLEGGSRVSLRQLISQHPLEILGRAVSERFSETLPFLFKVLSVAEMLSIQAHPDKEQARRLNALDPEHYPDGNHKPEIAVALDSLTALVGFKSFPDTLQALKRCPELAGFVGQEIVSKLRGIEALSSPQQRGLTRAVFTTLLERSVADEDGLGRAIDRLWERLNRSGNPVTEQEELFLDLREKHVGADVGLFLVFLLNLVHLRGGQGVYLEAGVPHAYLKGNIVECMANSDNVVRAGLTPKFRDVETLVDILTYEAKPVDILGDASGRAEMVYQTPAPEFQLSRWMMEPGEERARLTSDKPEILLVTRGEIVVGWGSDSESSKRAFLKGQAILIPAFLKRFVVTATTSVELFRVSVPLT